MVLSDDELFQDPPPKEDCQIRFLPMPYSFGVCGVNAVYMVCCGKTLCSGCIIEAKDEMKKGNMKKLCPFCRVPMHRSNEVYNKILEKQMNLGDGEAFDILGVQY